MALLRIAKRPMAATISPPIGLRSCADDAAVPTHLNVHLVLDDYATHKIPAIQWWLVKRPRFMSTSLQPVSPGYS